VRLNGIDINAGEVVEVEETLASTWINFGLAKPPVKSKLDEPNQTDNNSDDLQDKLKHVGGGYYELPNGEKIRGKEVAMEALKALEKGEKDGIQSEDNGSQANEIQNEAGNTASTGTSDTTGSTDSSKNTGK
jgi:hypothetical protein